MQSQSSVVPLMASRLPLESPGRVVRSSSKSSVSVAESILDAGMVCCPWLSWLSMDSMLLRLSYGPGKAVQV